MAETLWAGPGGEAELLAFLTMHATVAMFPLSNLLAHGLAENSHPQATRFVITRESGRIAGLCGLTGEGNLLPVGAPDLDALTRLLDGARIGAVLGETRLSEAVIRAVGLDRAPFSLRDDEPLFTLDLDALVLPDAAGRVLRPLSVLPRDEAERWRAGFAREVLGDSDTSAATRAARDVGRFLAADSHRILFDGARPLALTGFNARAPGIVQVGSVWTPPDLRGRGHARTAVALHLAEARAAGATRAVLAAASPAAVRAYRALGFRAEGRYLIALLPAPIEIAPCP